MLKHFGSNELFVVKMLDCCNMICKMIEDNKKLMECNSFYILLEDQKEYIPEIQKMTLLLKTEALQVMSDLAKGYCGGVNIAEKYFNIIIDLIEVTMDRTDSLEVTELATKLGYVFRSLLVDPFKINIIDELMRNKHSILYKKIRNEREKKNAELFKNIKIISVNTRHSLDISDHKRNIFGIIND